VARVQKSNIDVARKKISNSNLIGNIKILDKLVNQFSYSSNFHHAHIIFGNKGIGKATMVRNFIKRIVNNEDHYDLSVHPDIFILESNNDIISIDNIRDLICFVSLKSSSIQYKFILIDSIDDFNTASSNAILKILEEPTKNTYFFIINHNPSLVSETIQSRCIKIHIPNINISDFEQIMNALNPSTNQEVIKQLGIWTNYNPGMSSELIQNNGLNLYDKILDTMIKNQANIANIINFKEYEGNYIKFIITSIHRFLHLSLMTLLSLPRATILHEEKYINDYISSRFVTIEDITKKFSTCSKIASNWMNGRLSNEQAMIVILNELRCF